MTVEEAIEILEYDANKINNPTYQYKKDALKMAIEALKVEPKHGHWIWTGSCQVCSICDEEQYGVDTGRYYCPNCGAKMDGVENG